MSMDEFAFSLRMRDTIRKMTTAVVEEIRPAYRYGVVESIDLPNNKCSVVLNGDAASVRVSMGFIKPTEVGQTVRVEGRRGDRFIADVFIPYVPPPEPPTVEDVHVVGAVGEPAFQNGWGNFGGGFEGAGFWKDPYGVVHIHGLVAGGSVTSTIFTLPVGYRPQRVMRYPALANGVKVSLQVFTDGAIRMTATGSTSNSWISLSGVEFRAENDPWPAHIGDWVADNDVPGNSWSDENTADPPEWAGCWRRPDGMWYYRGYLTGSGAATIRVPPEASAPAYNKLWAGLGFTSESTGHVHERYDYDRKTGRYITLQSPTSVRFSMDNSIWPEAALYEQYENLDSLLINSWDSYKDTVSAKSDWGPPAIYKDPYGMCYMTGLLRNGSTSTNSVVLTLPEEYWPAARHIYTIRNGAGTGRLTVQENGAVLIGTGGDGPNNTYMSLDGLRFRAAA